VKNISNQRNVSVCGRVAYLCCLTAHGYSLESTQPLTEMSTRNLPGDKGWPVRKADNLTGICEPIV
jgi:hypothetical protein